MALIQLEYKSKALLRGVSVKVILPTDEMVQTWEAPYKTLYFLPGYSATANELITYLGLRAQSELKGIAIVLPDGENVFYQDMPERMTFYSTYVGKELVEMTRKLLPLSKKREDTSIGGISMGGYGALYNGIKYKDTFSKVVAFSPAVDAYQLMVERQIPGFSKQQFESMFYSKEAYYNSDKDVVSTWCNKELQQRPELFLCCGVNDGMVYEDVKDFEQRLKDNHIEHCYKESIGDHELYYWEQMMDSAFSFLANMKEGTRDKLLMPKRDEE